MSILQHTEAVIKSETTRLYKETFGQGPTNTLVHVWENVLTVKLFGAMTKLEEALISTGEGARLVHQIREHLVKDGANLYRQRLEEHLQNRIEDINYWLSTEENTLYVFIVFQDRITCRINGG